MKNLEHARVKAGAWTMRPRARDHTGHTGVSPAALLRALPSDKENGAHASL